MTAITAVPEQGQLVSVRQRHYVVTEVAKSSLPDRPSKSAAISSQSLVSLASVEDDGLGEELQVVWEIEPGAKTIEKIALPEPTGFDEPERLDAFLDAVRWGASSSADVRSVQSPFRSGIEIEDYQLDPVVRAVQMPRVNLLCADDVGLGKTIETGMVILELIIRHRARRVVVVCPAGLQMQWRDQMRDKFGLDFRIVDIQCQRQSEDTHITRGEHVGLTEENIIRDYVMRERTLRELNQPCEIIKRRLSLLLDTLKVTIEGLSNPQFSSLPLTRFQEHWDAFYLNGPNPTYFEAEDLLKRLHPLLESRPRDHHFMTRAGFAVYRFVSQHIVANLVGILIAGFVVYLIYVKTGFNLFDPAGSRRPAASRP